MKSNTISCQQQVEHCILEVRNLTTKLRIGGTPRTVVDKLSFNLHAGKTLALVGESGCGKSMTALSLMRLLSYPPALPPEGQVLYRNQNLLELPEAKMRQLRGRRLAMIFQDPMGALNPVYSIGDQLLEVVGYHLDLWGEAAVDKVLSVLEEVGMAAPSQRLGEYPHQLSGGMKQRVMIAMALLCEPDVLIADEPTTALDVTVQAQVLDLMRALLTNRRAAMLLITHDMGVVAEMADEVIVMYAGQEIERGAAVALFDRPKHPYTQGLFASRAQSRLGGRGIPGSVPALDQLPSGCRFHPRCSVAVPACSKQEPPMIRCTDQEHVRCWLHAGELSRE